MALRRSTSSTSNSISETSFNSTDSLNFYPICSNPDCNQPVYKCSYPECKNYICKQSAMGHDSYFYKIKNKQRVVCIDCLPFIAINLKTRTIKKRIIYPPTKSIPSASSSSDDDRNSTQDVFYNDDHASIITATSKQNWTSKNGFKPLSTAFAILMSAIYDAEKEKTA